MGNWDFIDKYGVLMAAALLVAVLYAARLMLQRRPASAPALQAAEDWAFEEAGDEYAPPSAVPEVEIGNAQTIGRRAEQDDYFASAATRVGTMAVIADGISGLSNGRMSSTLAVTTFTREFLKVEDPREIPDFFSKAAFVSNRAIMEQLGGENGGTTLVAVVICGRRLHWGAVGDSLLILFRDGELMPVNSKHTLETMLEERYLSGEISKEDIEQNPMRNQLTNYLGYGGFKSMEIGEPVYLEPGDTVVLCSDGVVDALTEVELEEILMRKLPPQETAEHIIEGVERKGFKHQDNATVMILRKRD